MKHSLSVVSRCLGQCQASSRGRWGGAGWLAVLLIWVGWLAPVAAQQPALSPAQQHLLTARNDPALLHKLMDQGRKVAAVCAHCHGPNGQSSDTQTPVLAGQNAAYLVETAAKYVDGRRRNMFMEGVLKPLTAEEMAGMALFYASQSVEPQPPQPEKLVEQGRKQYTQVCVACHGTDGRGTAQMPRLAGQHPGYVLLSLQHFKAGTGVRMSAEMQGVVSVLSEADMRALAAYVATLP